MADSSKTLDCRVDTAHQSRLCHCERSEAVSLHHSLFLVRHSIFTATFTFLLLLFLIAAPAQAKYGGGTGEPNDPYLIYTADQMNAIGADSNDWGKHFLLMADIDVGEFTGTSFNIIGYWRDWYDNKPFTGVFDGNGHTISNLTYDCNEVDNIGLFGYVNDPNAEIKDLGLIDPNVDAGTGNNIGSLIGCLSNGTTTDCYAQGGSVSGQASIGGLVGGNLCSWGASPNDFVDVWLNDDPNTRGMIRLIIGRSGSDMTVHGYGACSPSDCDWGTITAPYTGNPFVAVYEHGFVTNTLTIRLATLDSLHVHSSKVFHDGSNRDHEADYYMHRTGDTGGPAGQNAGNRTITNCYSTVSVSGETDVGGLVGQNHGNGIITNCNSTGNVIGNNAIGGLVGMNYATISSCSATGGVLGGDEVGGLVGANRWDGTITNSYSTTGVSGNNCVGGLVGYNGRTITNCYATGDIAGNEHVGGLVGTNRGVVVSCYSMGSVSGNTRVGGLVGYGDGPEQTYNSFWDIETSGQATSAGGKGKTTAQMQTASTFIGWGCEPVWTIDEGKDYPHLAWEGMPGEVIAGPIYGGGTGTAQDPYLIYTADELNMIGLVPCDWDKHFKLMADIDLSAFTGTDFNIIGYWLNYYSPDNKPFTGVFDGNGHTISKFSYTSTNTDGIGLFGYINDPNAEVKDLGLLDHNIYAGTGNGVGSLVGYMDDGIITGCYVQSGSVSGGRWVAGLVGLNYGTITNCYSSGSVSGDWDVGGLVGYNPGPIANCYSTGSVSGNRYVGGLVGRKSEAAVVLNSFWDIQTSGQTTSAGGTGKTTAEMMQQSTFTDWDFINTWNIGENQTYPYLRTVSASDINKDHITNFLDIFILCEEWLIEE